MKILMAATECVPFVKVGGLADVVGTLPKILKAQGHDVRIILPKYKKIDGVKFGLESLPYRLQIPLGKTTEDATLKYGLLDGNIPVYFVENHRFFFRPEVYRTPDADYPDNRERFVFFSRAVIECCKALLFQPDIIHCHDWQTGIIPAALKTANRYDGFYYRTASIYTIHNIAYQGIFDSDTIDIAGLSKEDFTPDRLEFYGMFNCMKAGLTYADMLSTVSPTYAREICSGPEYGRGMEGILQNRAGDLEGILNGIDYDEWSPVKDPLLDHHFSARAPEGKQDCKRALQKYCGFAESPETMVIGAVSRLDPQKGYDLVAMALPLLMRQNVQVVILGSGDRAIQETLTMFQRKWPGQISVHFDFNEPLAHRIYAGADVFMMPSLFEPCGLGQMISLAYGTVPVVNRTGGLADTITDFDTKTGKGNGFVMRDATSDALIAALQGAYILYQNKQVWKKLISNALMSDFSWDQSVAQYLELYHRALSKRSPWTFNNR